MSDILKEALSYGKDGQGSVMISTELTCDKTSIWLIKTLFAMIFKCESCGKCCDKHFFNSTPLLYDDMDIIKQNLNLSEEQLMELGEYLYFPEEKKSVFCIKQPCPFKVEGKCSIYDFRPRVCREFPLKVTETKIDLCVSCPGGNNSYQNIMKNGKHDEESRSFSI